MQDIVQGGADRSEIPDVFLCNLCCQVAVGNVFQQAGNFPDVISQSVDGMVEAPGKDADFIIGGKFLHGILSLLKPKFPLFQRLRHYGEAGKRGGNRFFDVCADNQDSNENQRDACQEGQPNRQANLIQGRGHGDSGENQAVNLPVRAVCRGIGAKVLFSQNLSLTHIAFTLFQHDIGNLGGKARAHSPLPVLLYRCVGSFVPVKNGELTAHFFFKRIQKRRFIFFPGINGQLICQHVCAAYAFILHYGHGEPVEHQYTQHHNQSDAHAQHCRNQISNLAADSFTFLLIISTVCVKCHKLHS